MSRSGARSSRNVASAFRQDFVSQRGGYRVDHATFHTSFRDHEFPRMPGFSAGIILHNDRHRLDRVPGKLCPEMLAPAHVETTVRRLQWRDVKPAPCQQRHPRGIGAELRPTSSAERKYYRISVDRTVFPQAW